MDGYKNRRLSRSSMKMGLLDHRTDQPNSRRSAAKWSRMCWWKRPIIAQGSSRRRASGRRDGGAGTRAKAERLIVLHTELTKTPAEICARIVSGRTPQFSYHRQTVFSWFPNCLCLAQANSISKGSKTSHSKLTHSLRPDL
jgi:hypothetical protein